MIETDESMKCKYVILKMTDESTDCKYVIESSKSVNCILR
jgi:hypothetical protein